MLYDLGWENFPTLNHIIGSLLVICIASVLYSLTLTINEAILCQGVPKFVIIVRFLRDLDNKTANSLSRCIYLKKEDMVQYKRETNQSYIDFLVSLDSFAMAVNWIVSTSRPFPDFITFS